MRFNRIDMNYMRQLCAFFIILFVLFNLAFQKVEMDFDAFDAPMATMANVTMAADYMLLADASVRIVKVFMHGEITPALAKQANPVAPTGNRPHKHKKSCSAELNNSIISIKSLGASTKFSGTGNMPAAGLPRGSFNFIPLAAPVSNHPDNSIHLLLVLLLFMLYFHSLAWAGAGLNINNIFISKKSRPLNPGRDFFCQEVIL